MYAALINSDLETCTFIANILGTLCDEFLHKNVSAILYLTNSELYGRSTAASQYFLQLAGYLGIPVIAWNADNSGLLRRASQAEMIVQLAPSVKHQAMAMLSILMRYNWHQFAIVTSQIAGHDDFVQAVRDRVLEKETNFKFIILATVMVLNENDLASLVGSEIRIVLLYCSREEAKTILQIANKLGLTGANFVWVVTQSVIGDSLDGPIEFPVGMLGVHFNTSHDSLKSEISAGIRVFVSGVEAFTLEHPDVNLTPNLSCEEGHQNESETAKWSVGDMFYKSLRNVSIELEHPRPPIQFSPDGILKNAELQIMNLRPGVAEKLLQWEQIGVWQSWKNFTYQLDIKDIVWPGYSHKPPDGVPEKFHLKIGFLEEAPYIKMADPDPITGKCSPDRGVLCRIANEHDIIGLNHTEVVRNSSYYQCCSGFCIDLLLKFEVQIGFTYELSRVPDGHWGSLEHGKWNGLIAELLNRKVDVVFSSLMINSERESVVDFSVPFMDSGVAILTAKRTGIIRPTAFLEPFDAALWMLVGLVGIQVYSLAIFFFEWLSPLGFDMKTKAKPGARFSLFRSCWLVWARLFQASVHIDSPRGFTAKFVVHVWSMFAVVFLATYTANLAVFMITREESHKFTGLHDPRLSNPGSQKPPMKFGTVQHTHTDSLLRKHHPEMYLHMMNYNVMNVSQGVRAVRQETLDAFLYDGPVLQYEVYQDTSDTCALLVEGTWYAHTGYGLAFGRNSKFLASFNKFLMEYKENGDLERLKRFYFTGPCLVEGGQRSTEYGMLTGTGPLALEQFLSAFGLLAIGIFISCMFLMIEKYYAKCIHEHFQDQPPGCVALVSQNMGRPFTHPWRASITSSQNQTQNFKTVTIYNSDCRDPICTTNLLRLQHQLKISMNRIYYLENRLQLFTGAYSGSSAGSASGSAVGSLGRKTNSCWPAGGVGGAAVEGGVIQQSSKHDWNVMGKYRDQLYRPSLTEIAEIETVL
ncbi:Glutamate receptor ionotropic, NMDA 2B [Folsomia candida]|uniref:Glutamate receptor ionotropic, NMDA 2B n=1 Tax=Folsomia candida TaxID=158441 RepID=A0A226EUI6_FOLCA|nr:Glutamate receptor ionotropic, NMDA 2B [Folsomia candida]